MLCYGRLAQTTLACIYTTLIIHKFFLPANHLTVFSSSFSLSFAIPIAFALQTMLYIFNIIRSCFTKKYEYYLSEEASIEEIEKIFESSPDIRFFEVLKVKGVDHTSREGRSSIEGTTKTKILEKIIWTHPTSQQVKIVIANLVHVY